MRSMPSASRSRRHLTCASSRFRNSPFAWDTPTQRAATVAYDVFHNSEPNRWIKAPATIDHRFLNEDVPYGLVAIAELGHVAQVPTPCANAVIEIASIVAGRSYRRDGLTRERMGIGTL